MDGDCPMSEAMLLSLDLYFSTQHRCTMKIQPLARYQNTTLATLLVLSSMVGCSRSAPAAVMPSPTTSSSTEQGLEGYWIRTSDSHRNAVIRVQKSGRGDYSATLLWAPTSMSSYGFSAGDLKWRDVVSSGGDASEFTGQDLMRFTDGSYEYEDSSIVLISEDRILERGNSSKTYYQRIRPDSAEMSYVDYGLGILAIEREQPTQALDAFQRMGRRKTKDADVLNAAAWVLATSRDSQLRSPKLALELSKQACELTSSRNAMFLDTLAAAYAASGNFDQAVETQKQALKELETLTQDGPSKTKTWALNASGSFLGPAFFYAEQKPSWQKRLGMYAEGKPYLE
jgi:tetratricopeptide (TPR) repeat protein